MFGFLRAATKPAAKPAVKPRKIGVDWGLESVVAVLLDEQGHPLDLRQAEAPPEGAESQFQGLESLLADWPLKDSQVVVSLTRDYHLATLELSDVNSHSIAQQLPYDSSDSRFAWWKLNDRKAVAIAYPLDLLHELSRIFRPYGARSVHFEAVELAQARLMQTLTLPAGMLTVYQDLVQLTLVADSDFESLTQSSAVLSVEAMIGLGLDMWTQRGHAKPCKLLTNLSPDYLERLSGLPCERLEEEAVAFHLALSPEGPHRFELVNP